MKTVLVSFCMLLLVGACQSKGSCEIVGSDGVILCNDDMSKSACESGTKDRFSSKTCAQLGYKKDGTK